MEKEKEKPKKLQAPQEESASTAWVEWVSTRKVGLQLAV